MGALFVDAELTDDLTLPLSVASTADSARAVLSTVASATMTFAGIAFSVTLLVFQMSSSQYSPRVIHGLFRDGFNKRVIGLVIGTFTYCLVVLRSVHGSIEGGADATVPTFSVTVAVFLGIVAVLAIVGFIDHNAHRMDVSQILEDTTVATKKVAGARWWPEQDTVAGATPPAPAGTATVVRIHASGWVQQLDVAGLMEALPAGATLVMATRPGRYVVSGTRVGQVHADAVDLEELERSIGDAVVIGTSRTETQDPTYGIRQMVDVALRALSPGINDPTTAQDAIFHITDALREMLVVDAPPSRCVDDRGRCVVLDLRSDSELVELAFGEIRRSSSSHPAVTAYLLAAIQMLVHSVEGTIRGQSVREDLVRQARLAVTESEREGTPEWELQPLEARLATMDTT